MNYQTTPMLKAPLYKFLDIISIYNNVKRLAKACWDSLYYNINYKDLNNWFYNQVYYNISDYKVSHSYHILIKNLV